MGKFTSGWIAPRSSACGAGSSTSPRSGHMLSSSSLTFFQFCISDLLPALRLPGGPDAIHDVGAARDAAVLRFERVLIIYHLAEIPQHENEVIGCLAGSDRLRARRVAHLEERDVVGGLRKDLVGEDGAPIPPDVDLVAIGPVDPPLQMRDGVVRELEQRVAICVERPAIAR